MSTSEEIEPVKERRKTGFADRTWWDKVDPETGLTNREKKSLWAKKAAQEGLIGGARPGAGRPRKNKALAEVVTEMASEPRNADQIAKELINMAKSHPSHQIKLGAIDRINKFEQDLERNMRDDEKEARKLHGKELDMAIAEALAPHGIQFDYDADPNKDIEEYN